MPCIEVSRSKNIVIEGFRFTNCWPVSVGLTAVQNVTLRNFEIEGSRRAIYALGESTTGITVEDVLWTQDISGQMWRQLDWAELHHGTLSHFNGALFASDGIKGNIVLRNNVIRDAFNGFRMEGNDSKFREVNKNIEIYNNLFERIRDNPIEPERSAYNWHIHHNKIHNAHAWFSFTEMGGGKIYVYGNTGWNDENYGLRGDHDEGTVLKFQNSKPFPSEPIYVFNNSWAFSGDYIRPKTPTRYLKHFNNILFSRDQKPSVIKEGNYHESYKFTHDFINFNIPKFMKSRNLWPGVIVGNPLFKDLEKGDFRIDSKSKAMTGGLVEFEGIRTNTSSIGAFEGSRPISRPNLD